MRQDRTGPDPMCALTGPDKCGLDVHPDGTLRDPTIPYVPTDHTRLECTRARTGPDRIEPHVPPDHIG